MLTGVDDAEVKDKYEKYLREGIISIGSSAALEWWINTAQRTRFPLLLRMAIGILSIPAMSSEVERVFSITTNTIRVKLHRLMGLPIEALEYLKSRFRLDLFTQKDPNSIMKANIDLGE